MKNNIVLLALSLCITLFATSCSKDEPSLGSFPSLNMLDENHGKTLLGETGVYINNSMNFQTASWPIVDLGTSAAFQSGKIMERFLRSPRNV